MIPISRRSNGLCASWHSPVVRYSVASTATTHSLSCQFQSDFASSFHFVTKFSQESSSSSPSFLPELMADQGKLVLYSYWRSSCSHRIRIVLNFKGLQYEYKAVNLLKGEQNDPEFEKINPMKFVPAILDGDALVADSFAIALYLEEKYPDKPLLPQDLKKKALNLQIASIVCSGIQPLHNLAVLNYIEGKLGSEEKNTWAINHISNGLSAVEKLLTGCAGKYATGDEIGLADVFLASQIYVAIKRMQMDMSAYPILSRLYNAYEELPAFQAALPENQPDAPSSS